MRLSVVIPMHNAADTVGEAIASLGRQRLEDWEAIVVDDGSTDGGRGSAVVEHIAAIDPRVRLVRQANGGVCRARNRGLDEARGEWVLFLDADDWMLAGGIDALLRAGERAGADGAVGTFELIGADGLLDADGPWSDSLGLDQLIGGIFMTTHGHIVRRRHYEEPAPIRFDPALTLIEDTDLWIRLAERGVVWANCHQAVGAYRMRPDSRSVRFEAMLACTVEVYRRAYARSAGRGGRGGVDASAGRLERVLGHAALGYSTRLAISDAEGGRIEAAAALLAGAPGVKRYAPRALGRSARHAVMFALGARPAAPASSEREPAWWRTLRAWWARCEREGWIDAAGGGASEAEREFRRPGPRGPARVSGSGLVGGPAPPG